MPGDLSDSLCPKIWTSDSELRTREFRLRLVYNTYNHFQGDSGGPLTYKSGDQHILIGETSFGPYPCAQVKLFYDK